MFSWPSEFGGRAVGVPEHQRGAALRHRRRRAQQREQRQKKNVSERHIDRD